MIIISKSWGYALYSVPLIFLFLMPRYGAGQDYNLRLSNGLDYTQGLNITELADGYLGVEWGFRVSNGYDEFNYCLFDKTRGKLLDSYLYPSNGKGHYQGRVSKGLYVNAKDEFFRIFKKFGDSTNYLVKLGSQHQKVNFEIVDSFYLPLDERYYTLMSDLMLHEGKIYGLINELDDKEDTRHCYLTAPINQGADTLFNIKLDNSSSFGSGVYKTEDNNYLLFGQSFLNWENKIFIFEINEEGMVISKVYTDVKDSYGLFNSALQIDDNFYLIYGVKKTAYSAYSYYSSPVIMLYDHSKRKILWKKEYPLSNAPVFDKGFEDMVPSIEAGHYMYAGLKAEYFEAEDSIGLYGLIGKIRVNSVNGVEVWQRKYTATQQGVYAYHELFDMHPTSDGHYIAIGNSHLNRYPGDTASWKNGWIIKINDNGDIVPLDTTSAVNEIKGDIADKIRIYPNPVGETLYINQDDIKDVKYEIYDLHGRKMDEITMTLEYLSNAWDVSHLKAGTYILQISTSDGKLGSMNFIKL